MRNVYYIGQCFFPVDLEEAFGKRAGGSDKLFPGLSELCDEHSPPLDLIVLNAFLLPGEPYPLGIHSLGAGLVTIIGVCLFEPYALTSLIAIRPNFQYSVFVDTPTS